MCNVEWFFYCWLKSFYCFRYLASGDRNKIIGYRHRLGDRTVCGIVKEASQHTVKRNIFHYISQEEGHQLNISVPAAASYQPFQSGIGIMDNINQLRSNILLDFSNMHSPASKWSIQTSCLSWNNFNHEFNHFSEWTVFLRFNINLQYFFVCFSVIFKLVKRKYKKKYIKLESFFLFLLHYPFYIHVPYFISMVSIYYDKNYCEKYTKQVMLDTYSNIFKIPNIFFFYHINAFRPNTSDFVEICDINYYLNIIL